ncbi:hypothetical protein [Thalassotalea montiporae]
MEVNNSDFIDAIDNLDLHKNRIKALVNSLSFDDNHGGMLVEDMSAILGIIYESTLQIESSSERLSKALKVK